MRAEDAQKLATSTLDELAAALEPGQSAQLKAFLAAAARFHSYSLRNVMLIAPQHPEATGPDRARLDETVCRRS